MGSRDKRLRCVLDWGYVGDLGMRGFKGTPGPWSWERNGSFIDIKAGELGIGDVCMSGHVFDNSDCLNGPITVANANLIAAAPELLEALQNMIGAFDNPIVRRKLPSDFNSEAILSARAAINKALGK